MQLFPLLLIVVLCCLFCVHANYERKWKAFKIKFDKYYRNPATLRSATMRNVKREEFHKKIFFQREMKYERHNHKYNRGLVSYRMKPNWFTDLSHQEIQRHTQGLYKPLILPRPLLKINSAKVLGIMGRAKIPKSVDWRLKGMVTPVKDVGKKNIDCWALAAIDVLESQLRMAKKPADLSVQELIDCAPHSNKGGWVLSAYDYMKTHGVCKKVDYPFTGIKKKKCAKKPAHVKIKGFVEMSKPGDEKLLAQIVATKGPVAVMFHIGGNFFSYAKGVYDDPTCKSKKHPNHAAVIVGYGTEKGLDYWLVKNSWGKDWGDDGYVKIARNKNNLCGIASKVSYPLV